MPYRFRVDSPHPLPGPQKVILAASQSTAGTTGTGLTPTATLSIDPPSISFPDTTVGATSANITIQVTNTSNAPVVIDRVFESGDFRVANTGCVTTLRVAATCNITVQFIPTTTGKRTGAITLTDAAAGSPQSVPLSGNGIAAAAAAIVSPDGLTFGNQAQSTTSNTLTVTLNNVGNLAFDASNVAATGDFQVASNNCAFVLAVGRTCTVQVTFTPTATGTRTGTLTFTNTAGTQTVKLTGTGVAETLALGFTPAAMTFQAQQTSVASPAQNLVIRNAGSAAVTISNISTPSGSDYQVNPGSCINIIQPGLSCPIQVTFTPSATGTIKDTLTITSNATGSPQTVALSGSGVTTAPAMQLSPSGLAFNTQVTSTTSNSQFVQLSNSSGSTVTGISFAPSGDFAISSNSCGTTLNAGTGCSFSVTFTPTVAGARTGSITITDSAGTQTVGLAGFGAAPLISALLVDTALAFPSQTPPTFLFQERSPATLRRPTPAAPAWP